LCFSENHGIVTQTVFLGEKKMSDSKMSRRSFLKSAMLGGLALTTGLTAHADDNEQEARAKKWVKKGKGVQSLSAFDTTMINFMSSRGISHGSLAVTKNGKLVLARGYSYVSDSALGIMPNALFRIASISKPITAVAVLHMAQNNLINLDEKLVNYITLTPIPGQTPDARLSNVTVRHLLHHVGGWNRDVSFDPMFRDFQIAEALGKTLPITGTDIIKYMSGRALDFTPGTQYAYSNYGYLLLEQLFRTRSGLSYAQYVKNNVWNPLGIKRTKLGKTAKSKRLANEVGYVSRYSGVSVLNNSGAFVKSPYGA
jgi:CubicO group peptidase (beta-lactamase class C family)